MASARCIACAVLGSSPVLQSASASSLGAVGARGQNFGRFAGSGVARGFGEVSDGFRRRSRCSDFGNGRSRNRSRNLELGQDLNLVTSRGQGFAVGANGRWWNSLLELADEGGMEEGPIELPPRELEIDPLAFPEASPAQIVASVALTGAIAVLLLRSLRRRAQRAKEMVTPSSHFLPFPMHSLPFVPHPHPAECFLPLSESELMEHARAL